ncbi:hypothetical protein [Cohnella soli]|uniref:DUF4363 family protein n=1 Tax=Cohnella soli TaxID=425005 RepID=A0ABW0I477_9BACL
MTSREIKGIKSDIVALVLIAAIIGVVALAVWVSRTLDDTTPLTRITETTERLGDFIENYGSLSPVQLMTTEFDPQIFIDAAVIAPDEGTANDLRYVASLITKYNDGATVKTLQEAYDIMTDVIPHFREATKNT